MEVKVLDVGKKFRFLETFHLIIRNMLGIIEYELFLHRAFSWSEDGRFIVLEMGCAPFFRKNDAQWGAGRPQGMALRPVLS
jgi:hypothetical protein